MGAHMALPTETTALVDYFDDLLFTGAYLSGTKGLAPLGKRVLDARKKVQRAVQGRNEKRDALVLANVAQSIAWESVREPLESLERQTDAHFDKDRAGYAKVFALKTSVLLRASESSRGTALGSVVTFATSRPPAKAGDAAREFAQAWKAYTDAATASATAGKALSAAIGELSLAKREGVVLMRETDGTLRAKFAHDPKQARRFFRTKPGKAEPKEASVAPAASSGASA